MQFFRMKQKKMLQIEKDRKKSWKKNLKQNLKDKKKIINKLFTEGSNFLYNTRKWNLIYYSRDNWRKKIAYTHLHTNFKIKNNFGRKKNFKPKKNCNPFLICTFNTFSKKESWDFFPHTITSTILYFFSSSFFCIGARLQHRKFIGTYIALIKNRFIQ